MRNNMPKVSSAKYLGVVLSEDMSIKEDEDRVTKHFLNSLILCIISSALLIEMLCIIFVRPTPYTSSFYGIETMICKMSYKTLNIFFVSYHKAV